MDLTSFETREALQEWIDEQDEPEEVTEELSDQLQGDELQGTPAQWVVYEAPSLMDEFPMGGVVQPETLDKKWDVYDEGRRRKYGDEDEEAQRAVFDEVKASFEDLTGAVGGGPDREGDTEIELDEDGKIVGIDDWWINDDKEGRWMREVDEFPYFIFRRLP